MTDEVTTKDYATDSEGDEFIESPPTATEQYYEYWQSTTDIFGILVHRFELDHHMKKLVAALDGVEFDESAPRTIEKSQRTFYEVLTSLLLTRSVDGYLTYVARTLTALFILRPEMLRSKKQVSLEFILQFDSMSDLVRAIADDEVDQLARQGFAALSKEIERRTGVSLFMESQKFQQAVELIEYRNLLVHNNGVINQISVKRVPKLQPKVGQKLRVYREALDGMKFLIESVTEFDARVVKKFGLPTIRLEDLRKDRSSDP